MTEIGTLTLADFLLARIAEDEAVLRDACSDTRIDDEDAVPPHEAVWRFTPHGEMRGRPLGHTTVAVHYRRFAAECAAKRRIVADCSGYGDPAPTDGLSGRALEYLALPYVDHPDFREEWIVRSEWP